MTIATESINEVKTKELGDALVLCGVTKKFGKKKAIDNISLTVKKGSFIGLLGPNGAGKTTLISIISGLIRSDTGDCQVSGFDTRHNSAMVKGVLGVVPQDLAIYPELSARDNLMFFGSMYGLRGRKLKERVSDALVRVGLQDRAQKLAVGKFSGGQKRRLNIAASLLHRPEVLILDEPTVGVDPQSRNHIFQTLRELNQQGMTILYTTHYMEEVESLCNEVAIIDHGCIIEKGSLQEVLETYGNSVVRLKIDPNQMMRTQTFLDRQEGITWHKDNDVLTISTKEMHRTVSVLSNILSNIAPNPDYCQIIPPSLETVFINLTGSQLRDK
jgi:ABC-2 type transport system ATP-binding protein